MQVQPTIAKPRKCVAQGPLCHAMFLPLDGVLEDDKQQFRLASLRGHWLTLVVALLPSAWLAWLESVADVVNIPLTALRDVTGRVGGWLRPDQPDDPSLRDTSLAELARDRDHVA